MALSSFTSCVFLLMLFKLMNFRFSWISIFFLFIRLNQALCVKWKLIMVLKLIHKKNWSFFYQVCFFRSLSSFLYFFVKTTHMYVWRIGEKQVRQVEQQIKKEITLTIRTESMKTKENCNRLETMSTWKSSFV